MRAARANPRSPLAVRGRGEGPRRTAPGPARVESFARKTEPGPDSRLPGRRTGDGATRTDSLSPRAGKGLG